MIRAPALLLMLAATPAGAETVDQVAARHGFAGELLVVRGDRVLLHRGYGTVAPGGTAKHRAGARWRLASITKQVAAALLLRREAAALDRPVRTQRDRMLPPGFEALTLRQLLTHHSGLANPDDTPADEAGMPAFYRAKAPSLRYCLRAKTAPGGAFAYNNCDYIVAAATTRGRPLAWPDGMAMARTGERGVPGFVAGKPEPAFELASWGAAGGLVGTARAVLAFDRALMTGRLLAPAVRDVLWTAEGKGSYQALGQWVFPGTLKGCDAPKRIVQRDGEIGGVQARNFILPDDDLVVIAFTNRSSDDFGLGEVWQGKGFTYDLLSAVACA